MKDMLRETGYSYNWTTRTLLDSTLVDGVEASVVSGDLPGVGVLAVLNQIDDMAQAKSRHIPTLVLGNRTILQVVGFDLRNLPQLFPFTKFQMREVDYLAQMSKFLLRLPTPVL